MSLRVAVIGAAGRMGLETVRAIVADDRFALVAAVGRSGAGDPVLGHPDLTLEADLEAALDRSKPQVVIDYAPSDGAEGRARAYIRRGIPFVFGTSGIAGDAIGAIRSECETSNTPGMIVPNFALGAVLMMRFAEMAARWLPDCEIVEMHHERKLDAPSGTAMLTAQRIANARASEPTSLPPQTLKVEGARGGIVDGVPIHSVRLPGLLAHQVVIFGQPGEVLTIRHDSMDRAGFMAGVKLCLTRVGSLHGLTIGMDSILD